MRTLLKIFLISYVALCSVVGVGYFGYFSQLSAVSASNSTIRSNGVIPINPPSILLPGEIYNFELKVAKDLVGKGKLEISSDNGTLVSLNGFSSTGGDNDAVTIASSSFLVSIKPLNSGLVTLTVKYPGGMTEIPLLVKDTPALKMAITNFNDNPLVLGDMSKAIRIDLLDQGGQNSTLKEDLKVSIKKIPGLEVYDKDGVLVANDELIISKGTSSKIFTIKQTLDVEYLPLELSSSLGSFFESIYMSEGNISKVSYDFLSGINYQVGDIVGPIKLKWLNQFGVEIVNRVGQEVKILSSSSEDIKCGSSSIDITSQGSVFLNGGESNLFCIFYKSGERDLSFFVNPDVYINDSIKPLAFIMNPGVPEKLVMDDESISLELGEQKNISAYLVDRYGNKVNSDTLPVVRIEDSSVATDNSLISLKGEAVGSYQLAIDYDDYHLSTTVSVVYGDVVSINPSYYTLKLEDGSSPMMLEFRGYNKYGYNVPVSRDYIISGLNPDVFTNSDGIGIESVDLKKGNLAANVLVKNTGNGVLQYNLHTDLNEFAISIDSITNNLLAETSVLGSSTIYGSDYRVVMLDSKSAIRVGDEVEISFLLTDKYGNVILPDRNVKYQIYADKEGTIKIGDLSFQPYSSFARLPFYTEKLGEQYLYIYNERNYVTQFEVQSAPGKPFKLDPVNVDYSLKESVTSDMYIFELVDKFGNKTTADNTLEFSVSSSKNSVEISLLLDPWKNSGRIYIYQGESIVSFYTKDSSFGEGVINLSEVKHSVENFEFSYEMEK